MNSDGRELHLVEQFIQELRALNFGRENDDLIVRQFHQNVEQRLVLHVFLHVCVELFQTVKCEVLLVIDLDHVVWLVTQLLSRI